MPLVAFNFKTYNPHSSLNLLFSFVHGYAILKGSALHALQGVSKRKVLAGIPYRLT